MIKKQKTIRVKRRYVCEKCGRKSAVKHDKGRYRCLECHSIYGENSKKTCYNKEEYLVLKTLLQLFAFKERSSRKNSKYSLEECTKMIKEQPIDSIKKLVEINVINRIDLFVKQRLLDTALDDMIILTKDEFGRFQLYTKLFKENEEYNFKHSKIRVSSGGKYHYENSIQEIKNII